MPFLGLDTVSVLIDWMGTMSAWCLWTSLPSLPICNSLCSFLYSVAAWTDLTQWTVDNSQLINSYQVLQCAIKGRKVGFPLSILATADNKAKVIALLYEIRLTICQDYMAGVSPKVDIYKEPQPILGRMEVGLLSCNAFCSVSKCSKTWNVVNSLLGFLSPS